jgi:hypothetical protein
MAWTDPKTWVAETVVGAADLNEQIRDNENYLKTNIELGEAGALTVADGVITVSQSYHKVAGESSAADELDTISGGSEGMVIILRPNGDPITFKNETGNLMLGRDTTLSLDTDHIILVYGDDDNWHYFIPPSRTRHAKAMVTLDLSGAAAASVILHPTQACTITKLTFLYTEASSGDAGITITVGKESDPDYYYTGTTEISKAQFYEKDCTLLAADVESGDTILVDSAGSKAGTGEILALIEYEVND